ncbi:MAG: CoA-binding protein [Bacteroidia bacterium]|nr:CoA-binding protein [Bacteroidia bacterium]MBP9690294.1 CoA-binding protein [Bacteroidia bacterium]
MPKTTLVLGATPNTDRYAYKATEMLLKYGHPVVLYGIKAGEIAGITIQNKAPQQEVDTVTLYVGPQNQPAYYDYIIGLKPTRVIFNPGTENPEFENKLKHHNIEPVIACTLVMLATGQY